MQTHMLCYVIFTLSDTCKQKQCSLVRIRTLHDLWIA